MKLQVQNSAMFAHDAKSPEPFRRETVVWKNRVSDAKRRSAEKNQDSVPSPGIG